MAYILYKLTFANGKVYIGQTVRKMQTRFAQHRGSARSGSLLPVHCAWRLHGEPELEIVGHYDSHEELHAAEIRTIREMNCRVPNGYNISFGGDSPSTAPEVRAKIGEKSRGRKQNPLVKSAAAKKMWQSDEYREAVSRAVKSSWESGDLRASASSRSRKMWDRRAAEGWQMPEETKRKLSARTISDETRAKMSAAAKARKRGPVSAETREKLSAATKAAWKDPEITERRMSAIRKCQIGARN